MNKKLLLAAIAMVVGIAGYVVWNQGQQEPMAEAPTAAEAEPAPMPVNPDIRYPIERPAESASPLPALDASDAALGDALAQSLGMDSLPAFFYPDKMVRRFVVTVDNLPRSKVPARMMPVEPVAGPFQVSGTGSRLAIAPANSARYGAYIDVMESVDVPRLVDLYVRFYPLFQQAYVELGYPKGHFNDRLVAMIDDLLAAPDIPAPVELVQPHVLYQFADRELEALSAGQKIMVRMGSVNAERAKTVLRAIRSEVLRRGTDR